MKNKVITVTPEGALKKMNFTPNRSMRDTATKIEVDAVLSKVPGRYKAISCPPPVASKIVMRGGLPYKIVDGKWVALTKVAK